MPGHPDYDAGVVWQAPALYSQFSGPIPAAGTVLYQGPITGYPSIQLRMSASTGGFRVRVEYYLDSGFTQLISSQVFDASTLGAQSGVYEVLGPFLNVRIDAVTAAPAAAGLIVVIPSRAPALSFRPNVFPQNMTLNGVTIPASTTSFFGFPFVVLGDSQLYIPSIVPANALTVSLNGVRWDGSTGAIILPPSVIVAPYLQRFFLTTLITQLAIQNTTANPATITASMTTQQQGW